MEWQLFGDENFMKVLVMDDAPNIRARVVELLADVDGIEQIYESSDTASAVDLLRAHRPDVVILDIQVPPSAKLRNGIDLLRLTKREFPQTGVIMLTNFANPMYQTECNRLGADYFLDKSQEFEQVPDAVRALLERAKD